MRSPGFATWGRWTDRGALDGSRRVGVWIRDGTSPSPTDRPVGLGRGVARVLERSNVRRGDPCGRPVSRRGGVGRIAGRWTDRGALAFGSGTGQARPLRTAPSAWGEASRAFSSGATFVGATLAVARFRDVGALDGSRRVGVWIRDGTSPSPTDRPVALGRGVARVLERSNVRRGDPCGRPVSRRGGVGRIAARWRLDPGRDKPVPYGPPRRPGARRRSRSRAEQRS